MHTLDASYFSVLQLLRETKPSWLMRGTSLKKGIHKVLGCQAQQKLVAIEPKSSNREEQHARLPYLDLSMFVKRCLVSRRVATTTQ